MNTVKVMDNFGREVEVDMDTAKMHSYSNKEKKIIKNVQMIEDGKPSMFWTDITVEGTVDSIEERCEQFNNPLILTYASTVQFNAKNIDPDKKIWDMFMKWARENQDRLFDEFGDWKKVIIANPSKGILEVVESRRGGKRKGAGRKPTGLPPKETWSVKVTEEEKAQLIEYLAKIRESK